MQIEHFTGRRALHPAPMLQETWTVFPERLMWMGSGINRNTNKLKVGPVGAGADISCVFPDAASAATEPKTTRQKRTVGHNFCNRMVFSLNVELGPESSI